MSDTTRTFIAIPVPDVLTLRLTRLQQQLAGEIAGVRWGVALPFHVTLAFLGEVAHSDLVAICRAVERAVVSFPPFSLKLAGLGAFPDPSRPRVIWTGLTGPGVEPLVALRAAVAVAVAGAGYATDAKPFHPHVTLGRVESTRGRDRHAAQVPTLDLTRLVNHYKTWHAGPFPVNQVVLYSSTLDRDGPTYSPLGHAVLASRKDFVE